MNIIPVIDIRNGIAVRAVAGERATYRPLESDLTQSVEPAEVLAALHEEYGCRYCYVADLDAIDRGQMNRCALAEMARSGIHLLVDAGTQTTDEVEQLVDIGVHQVIVSSESLLDLNRLPILIDAVGQSKILFSVDLKAGRLKLADITREGCRPLELIRDVIAYGVNQLIILDLSAVGTGKGIPTLSLCISVKQQWPDVRVVSGGGVHSPECLESAQQASLDGLLISSALHDGRLTREQLASYVRGW